jgi:hypothetical protein
MIMIMRWLQRDLSRMSSSGMLRNVALLRIDVSEEPSTSIIRVTIGEEILHSIFFAECLGC